MPAEDATPIIFFIVSLYGFAVVLLYVLARAWAQALSTRPQERAKVSRGTAGSFSSSEKNAGSFRNSVETISAKSHHEG